MAWIFSSDSRAELMRLEQRNSIGRLNTSASFDEFILLSVSLWYAKFKMGRVHFVFFRRFHRRTYTKRFAFRSFNAAVLKSDNFAALITHLYKPTFLGVYLNTLDRSCLPIQTVPLLAADVPGGEKMRSRRRKLQQQPCLLSFASSPPCNGSVQSKKILSFYTVHLF